MLLEDLVLALENYDLHIKSKVKHPYDQDVRCMHSNGSTIWIRCRGKVVRLDNERNPIRMVGAQESNYIFSTCVCSRHTHSIYYLFDFFTKHSISKACNLSL